MFAVFETGGKQYKVSEGDVVKIDGLNCADTCGGEVLNHGGSEGSNASP